MIQVAAVLGDGHLALTVEGHEDHQADGVVCAAVSAVTQTALLGLAEIARQHPDLVRVDVHEQE